MMRSKYTVLFYDEHQSVKSSDITPKEFNEALKLHNSLQKKTLLSQLRCLGGEDFINYIDDIFSFKDPKKKTFGNYKTVICDDVNHLIKIIKENEAKFGLCRLMAGYGWEWKTKGMKYDDIVKKGLYDININGTHLIWNTESSRWLLSANSKNEVGCIHTTQGYDLYYSGLIFGPEIDYDPIKNDFIIDKNKFYDVKVKNNTSDDELRKYIINSYSVMMKRGIHGIYIYCVNKNLRDYFAKYFENIK